MLDIASLVLGATLMAKMDTVIANGFETAACPYAQQENANISYSYNLTPVLQNVDVTEFQNVWGRNSANDTIVPWPGKNGYAVMTINRNLFFATRFTVPASGLSPTLNGRFTHGETVPGPNLTMSISPTCGDFNPSSALCKVSNAGPGVSMVGWRLPTGSAQNLCVLTPGQQYYANFKLTDPNAVDTMNCGLQPDNRHICVISIVNNVTP